MSQPPNLIIYNTNKKIVQLSKVVSNLTSKIDEHFFHLSFLEKFYGDQFQDIYEIHEKKITKIISEIQNHRKKVNDEMSTMYSESYENQKEKFDNAINSMKDSIEQEQNKYLSELSLIQQSLLDISSQLIQLTSKLAEPLTDIFSNAAGETIAAILEKNEKEIKQHDEESERKLNLLKEETKTKIKSFDSSYGKIVDNLKKQFYSSTKDIDKFKPFLELQEQFKILNLEIHNQKEELHKVSNEKSSQIANFQNILNSYSKDYQNLFISQNNQMNEIENEINNFDCSSIELLKQEYERKKHQFSEEITKVQSEMAQMLLIQKTEKETILSLVHSTESLSDDQLNELKERQLKEFNQIRTQYEKLYPPLIQLNEELKKQLDDDLNTYQSNENEYMQQLNTQKEEHLKEFKFIKDQQDDEMHLEYAKFESRMAVLHKKLGHNKLLQTDSQSAIEQREELQNEICKLNEEYDNWTNEFDSTFQQEKENQLIENNQELEKIRKEEEDKLTELKLNASKELESNEIEFKQKTIDLKSSLESKYHLSLELIPQEFKGSNPIVSLTQSYVIQYQSLSKLLDEEMKDTEFKSNEDLLQQTIDEKNQLKNKIEDEKRRILKQMKNNEEDEIKRHQFTLTLLVPLHSDDELEKKRKETNDKIHNLVQKQDDLLFTLRQLREVKQPKLSISGFLEDEEVINLRKKLEIIRDELQDQRHKKQIEFEEAIANQNDEIELEIKKIEENYENETVILEKERQMKNEELSQLAENQIEYQLQSEMNYPKFQEKLKISFEKLTIDIENNINHSKIRIQQEQENLKNLNIDFNSQVKKSKKRLKKEYKQLIIDIENEKKMILEKRDDYLKRLDNHLSEHEKACYEAKIKAQNIPMRPEEKAIIDRLENQLTLKTQQLNAIAKDMMAYKNRLKQQEDEYNRRFGVSPQVAIMRASDQRRNPKSALLKKPLPPLKNSLVC